MNYALSVSVQPQTKTDSAKPLGLDGSGQNIFADDVRLQTEHAIKRCIETTKGSLLICIPWMPLSVIGFVVAEAGEEHNLVYGVYSI